MLSDEIAEFLIEKRRKAVGTYEQYHSVLERVFLPWATKHKITEAKQIDDKVLYRFTDDLAAKRNERGAGLSPATIHTYIRNVRIFLKWADVPRGRYEAPRKPRRLREVLDRDEIDRLERAAPDERDRLIVRVLADTGVRVSELIGLRRADLRENAHERQGFIRVIGKGDKEREVAVPRETFQRLQARAKLLEMDDYLFTGKRRRPGSNGYERLTKSGVDQLMRNLGRTAKLTKKTNPHSLRHAYVTHLLKRGVNLVVIQKTVGHSTLAMISEVYSHLQGADSYDVLTRALRS
jgi:site-specific recombinase XerD